MSSTGLDVRGSGVLDREPSGLRVSTQIAACRSGLGVAARTDLSLLELRGRPVALRSVTRRRAGRRLAVGEAVCADGVWWCLLEPHRLLVIGPRRGHASRWDDLRAASREVPDTTVVDVSGAYAPVTLAGPRAGELLAGGAVGRARPTVALPESHDRWLLVVPTERAAAAWRDLLAEGRALGVTVVGCEAIELLRAADAVADCQHAVSILG